MSWSVRIWRLAVGIFAGALASFFPRLATVLAGNPTENVALFSPSYLVVGVIVALVVGVVITIIDDDPARPLRDLFMTALGVPTLLMGALSTSATAHNAAIDQVKLKAVSDQLAQSARIEVRPSGSGVPLSAARGPGGVATALESLIPSAHAQTQTHAPGNGVPIARQSAFGITSVEPQYTTVLKEAAAASDLRALQESLAQRGLGTQIVTSAPGRSMLVPAGAERQPYSAAVLAAVRAKELGANPYLVQAK